MKKIGLLGTKFTIEYDFFKSKLNEQGIEALIPAKISDKDFVHNTIFDELGKGIIKEKTKKRYLSIIEEFKKTVLKEL